ncbi:hypothetical protein LEP3755_40870 [Leptolyngbya sp. NIES-3755]|nr:hypothetical protein LEP3755_40870 [Leptolyngbya sp. NIES-3755]
MRAGVPDRIRQEIVNAQDVMIRNNVSADEQLKLLTQRYGQYAKFYKPRGVVFTAETLALRERMQRANEADMMAILRPDQQKVYRANLIRARQIEACNPFKANG